MVGDDQQNLPSSLRKHAQQKSGESRFNFSWIGGIAQRIRNALNQKSAEEALNIERQSDLALRESTFSHDLSQPASDSTECASMPHNSHFEDHASSFSDPVDADDAAGSKDHSSNGDRDDYDDSDRSAADETEERAAKEQHEESIEVDDVDEIDEIDYELANEDVYDTSPTITVGLKKDEVAFELDEDLMSDVVLEHSSEHGGTGDDHKEEVSEPESEPEYEPVPEPVPEPEADLPSDSVEDFVEDYGSNNSPISVELSEHEAQEHNPEMSSMSLWEENGFESYETPVDEQPIADSNPPLEDKASVGDEPTAFHESHVEGSRLGPVERYLGFSFGPELPSPKDEADHRHPKSALQQPASAQDNGEDKGENASPLPQEDVVVSMLKIPEDRVTQERLTVEPAGDDDHHNETAMVSNESQENGGLSTSAKWNLFRVGFTVAPAASAEESVMNTVPEVSVGFDIQNDENAFEEEFSLLAHAAHRLLSGSSLFGGKSVASAATKRKHSEEIEGMSHESEPEDVDAEISRVTGTAHLLFSNSSLFGGKPPKRQKLEQVSDENVEAPSNSTTNSDAAAPSDATVPAATQEKAPAKKRSIPTRRRPVTRSMLRAMEKEAEEAASKAPRGGSKNSDIIKKENTPTKRKRSRRR